MNHMFKIYKNEYGERSYVWGDPVNWRSLGAHSMVLVVGVPEGLAAKKVADKLHRVNICRSVIDWADLVAARPGYIFIGSRLTTIESASFLGLSRRAVQLALMEGRLPGTKTGRDWTLCKEDLELLVKHGLFKAKPRRKSA